MAHTIERDGEILLVNVSGPWTAGSARTVQDETAELVNRHGLRGLLIDIREAELDVSTMDIYEVTVSHETAYPPLTRHAVLYNPVRFHPSDAAFFENVAANRGMAARAFTDRSEAIRWLREDAGPPSS